MRKINRLEFYRIVILNSFQDLFKVLRIQEITILHGLVLLDKKL